MDLGLDRGDMVGALDAYGPAVERVIDLGAVNGRPFVNNVSLGLYAVGPRSRPFDLPILDSGRLGVITPQLPEGAPDRALLAAIAAGRRIVSPVSSPGSR